MSIAYWLICSKNHCNEGNRKIQIFFDNINIKKNPKKIICYSHLTVLKDSCFSTK